MNSNSIDEILKNAAKDSEKFFSNFNEGKVNSTVLLKLTHNSSNRPPIIINGFVLKASALSICLIIFLIISSMGIKIGSEKTKFASMGKPVSQQQINFGDKKIKQWLNYFMINKPDKKMEGNLLAVIWKTGNKGDYEMVYSSVFENSNKPCPVDTIDFPGNQPSLLLISSQNDTSEYIHYKVLGYKGNKVLAYMEQDYVTGGKIEIKNGVLKETRSIPNSYIEESYKKDQISNFITHYIPYQHNKFGDIIPSVEYIKVFQGEVIALVGDYNVPINIKGEHLYIQQDIDNIEQKDNKDIKYLYAKELGYEDIYIKSKNGSVSKRVSVEVIDKNDSVNKY